MCVVSEKISLGADLLVIASNTMHRLADSITTTVSIPIAHIADSVANALEKDGHNRIGLLGTNKTMQSGFYREYLADRLALEFISPCAATQAELGELLVQTLATGVSSVSSNSYGERVGIACQELRYQNCSAVLVVGHELVSMVDTAMKRNGIPIYDATALHALSVVDLLG